jgi:hypothetical protein
MKSSSAALSSVADPLVRCSSPTDCDDVIGLVPVVSQTVHERQRKILVEENRHDAWRTAGVDVQRRAQRSRERLGPVRSTAGTRWRPSRRSHPTRSDQRQWPRRYAYP